MKRLFKISIFLIFLAIAYSLLSSWSSTNDKYILNQDLINQVSASIPEYTPIDKISPDFVNAIVVVEDRRFYKHHGFDVESIGRALITNVKEGSVLQGGSTITQQLAKNLFLSSDKTYTRKIKELIIAIQLEHLYSKNEILEMYVNVIYYGSGAYGIQAASHTYFGKDAANLSLAESAMLAGLPQAPSAYNPKTNPGMALKRQKAVLTLMTQQDD